VAKAQALSKEILELAFDNVENGIYLVDDQGVTIRVNRTFEEMSGFTNDELAGNNLKDLVGPDNYFTGVGQPAGAGEESARHSDLLHENRPQTAGQRQTDLRPQRSRFATSSTPSGT